MNQGNVQNNRYRWIPVIASIAIQMCLGTAYIWSVFQSYLIKGSTTPNALFEWPATHGTLAYSLLLGVLTLGSIVGGKIHNKLKNPRPAIISGGIILGVGFFLAQFTTESTPWLLWLTYGVLGGFGMGMAYTTTISTCQKWFPDRRGMVTGIIVSALGFGGLVFTPIAEALIGQIGVLKTFAVLGFIFIVVTVLGAIFIKNPPEDFKPAGWTPSEKKTAAIVQDFTPGEVLKMPQFYMITLAMMCATAAGSMMIPMAKILGLQPDSGLSSSTAVAGVMIISICNSFGRLFWGWTSDKLGRKQTILILLFLAGASIIGVSFAKAYIMLAFIAVIGFSYGGFLGVFPALTADFWGTKHGSQIYGMVLLGFGVGAVASSYIVAYFSKTKAFSTAFIIAAIAALVGIVIISFIKAPRDKAKQAVNN
ncbi:OFA family MFS transporter [Ruminiclostridium herbifermentans]|uniref:OFA family MFS transporter n=1 Tax=Ruminiclostridium herbifermentans TaxID=2488810 RepID=A0A4U7JIF0_9FIRM|nr:OFA family MFS transporter [Ruminiclostridium herbifermentans]QNU65449.1 OFA family MFS transporter [Ruminiclostridium herbifermentans]